MEEINLLVSGFINKYPMITIILGSLGTLMLAAQSIVLLTPTKKDDVFVEELMKKSLFKGIYEFIVRFAPFGKK